MPVDSNLHGHLSVIPKSHKFELSLCAVCCSLLVMVSDRRCSADNVSFPRFISSLPRARTLSRDVPAGAGVLCDEKAFLLVDTTTKTLCTVLL